MFIVRCTIYIYPGGIPPSYMLSATSRWIASSDVGDQLAHCQSDWIHHDRRPERCLCMLSLLNFSVFAHTLYIHYSPPSARLGVGHRAIAHNCYGLHHHHPRRHGSTSRQTVIEREPRTAAVQSLAHGGTAGCPPACGDPVCHDASHDDDTYIDSITDWEWNACETAASGEA